VMRSHMACWCGTWEWRVKVKRLTDTTSENRCGIESRYDTE